MTTMIKVPTLGESVSTATIARWLKKPGDAVAADEPLVELETDKVTVEVNSPVAGTLSDIAAPEGAEVEVGAMLGNVGEAGAAPAPAKAPVFATSATTEGVHAPIPPPGPLTRPATPPSDLPSGPAVDKLLADNALTQAEVGGGTGKDGRLTKGDVLAILAAPAKTPAPAPALAPAAKAPRPEDVREERVKMTRLRRTIAARLKEAQNTAAMLTTFNEVDMSAVMALRNQYKDVFEKTHGVRLGFMSFFVKACVFALKAVPDVNAEIDGTDLIYKNHYDIGVAVGTERGLVVPVLREADTLNLAGIEKGIGALGKKARDGQLAMEDLQGGTFTISNGGVYGSLMSTPILNQPQSGILGMHKIQDRPMAVNGQVVIRPMMYLALSYDHRVVDGQGAVTFLVKVKEHIEDPQRLLLEV